MVVFKSAFCCRKKFVPADDGDHENKSSSLPLWPTVNRGAERVVGGEMPKGANPVKLTGGYGAGVSVTWIRVDCPC